MFKVHPDLSPTSNTEGCGLLQLFKALLTLHTVKVDRLEVGRAGNSQQTDRLARWLGIRRPLDDSQKSNLVYCSTENGNTSMSKRHLCLISTSAERSRGLMPERNSR